MNQAIKVALVGTVLLMCSCAHNQWVQYAEKTHWLALQACDTYVRYEKEHRLELWAVDKGFKESADYIRRHKEVFPEAFEAIQRYKETKHESDLEEAIAQISMVEELWGLARQEMTKVKVAKGGLE